MKATGAARNTNASHPPLAHDAEGRPIAMPEGSAWWGLKRCTAGRPKAVLGPDRRAVRLPLDTTEEEIAETYGPDTYRLDALDEHGDPIDHVTTSVIGDPCDNEDEEPERQSRGFGGGRTGSDLRFALQTNTEMARALSESLKAVAMAQADWVKGLASAKAIPRNAVYVAPRALPAPSDPDDDGDDDDDDDDDEDTASDEAPEPTQPPGDPAWLTKANQLGETIYKIGRDAPGFYAAFRNLFGKGAQVSPPAPPVGAASPPPAAVPEAARSAPPSTAPETAPTPPPSSSAQAANPLVHFCAIDAQLSRTERGWLRRVLRTQNADALTRELMARTVPAAAALVKAVFARDVAPASDGSPGESPAPAASPPSEDELRARVVAVLALLTPDEKVAVFGLFRRLTPVRFEQLSAQLFAMTDEEAAAWIRENLPRLQAEHGS